MRTPILSLAAVCLMGAAAAAGGAGPIPTFSPGPFGAGWADWDFGPLQVSDPTGPGTTTVQHFGRLVYPSTGEGEFAPLAPGTPFPFVVFAHGRFQSAGFIGTNHLQASYLLEHLASWGFVVASVNLDDIGAFGFPAAIPQRGEIVHATIDAFEALDPAGVFLDMGQLGLVGHSRGGEGALAAHVDNPQGHNFVAIATIAPTDFEQYLLEDVPYLCIYGSKDGDVNNGWPIFTYDNATGSQKVFEYCEGANHFWFTETIQFSGEGDADIPREVHHDIARTYVTSFLRSRIQMDPPEPFTELSDGPSLFPVLENVVIHPMYDDVDALKVNDFEDLPADPSQNSLGALSLTGDLLGSGEQSFDNAGLTLYHKTRGAGVSFDMVQTGETGFYAEQLPPGTDASGFTHLSLRAIQILNAPQNTPDVPQDLSVALLDAGGVLAVETLSTWGTVPYPITHGGFNFPSKSVLRTTRIPLSAFTGGAPGLDLTDLQFVGLVFDQTTSGNLRFDNIAFTD